MGGIRAYGAGSALGREFHIRTSEGLCQGHWQREAGPRGVFPTPASLLAPSSHPTHLRLHLQRSWVPKGQPVCSPK